MIKSKWTFILTVAAAVAGGATSASADTFTFTSCHIDGGCGPAPFGTVTLTQSGANVHVSVSGPNFTFFAGTGAIKDGNNPANPPCYSHSMGPALTRPTSSAQPPPPRYRYLTGLPGRLM